MRFDLKNLLSATAMALALGACVPETTPVTAPPAAPAPVVVPPPVDQPNAAHYSAQADGEFTVPTVPVEKVPAAYQKQDVDFPSNEPVGSIIINPAQRHLYLITAPGRATQYGIAVGKAGFEWAGVANITGRKNWPTWTPPKEMIERKPELDEWKDGMPGGPKNPLGARALYLTTNGVDYGYRIHGTPDWWSIGKNASSGCIRMINQDVMELYNRVQDGAKVVVLNADGSYPSKLKLPPKPVATKAKATPKASKKAVAAPVAPPVIVVPKPMVMPAPVITTGAAPATPAVTTPVVTPVVTAPAATAPLVAPAATVSPAISCAVPLVNGVCPN